MEAALSCSSGQAIVAVAPSISISSALLRHFFLLTADAPPDQSTPLSQWHPQSQSLLLCYVISSYSLLMHPLINPRHSKFKLHQCAVRSRFVSESGTWASLPDPILASGTTTPCSSICISAISMFINTVHQAIE